MKLSLLLVSALGLLPGCGSAPGDGPTTAGATGEADGVDVVVKVDPAAGHPISPYIYGINFAAQVAGLPARGISLDRAGGNRWTTYNWENNASNAGSDWNYQSDGYLGTSPVPGEAVRALIEGDRAAGMASLITVPMQGLVAADAAGPVSMRNPPDMSRFKVVVPEKATRDQAPFTTMPPTGDAFVYVDEFLWALDQMFPGQAIFGATPATQPVFVALDNEPELWSTTHREIQGAQPVRAEGYIAKTIVTARAIKARFPGAVIFGPVHAGFFGIQSWNGELLGARFLADGWFIDKYLAALKAASAGLGHPLVDVYDLHWYPEATDAAGNRVARLNGPELSAEQVQAIVQSPRSLWDPDYREQSWITKKLGGPINLLPRLRAKIDAGFPGLKLAITEYNNGGGLHIAGAIAEADNLGIFGVQGLFAATYWPMSKNEPFILAGLRAFRDFDGAGADFGDISLGSTSSRVRDVVVYASRDTANKDRSVFVAINKSGDPQVTRISGVTLAGTAHFYQVTAASAQGQAVISPVAAGTQAVRGDSMTISLPALSVTTIDVH